MVHDESKCAHVATHERGKAPMPFATLSREDEHSSLSVSQTISSMVDTYGSRGISHLGFRRSLCIMMFYGSTVSEPGNTPLSQRHRRSTSIENNAPSPLHGTPRGGNLMLRGLTTSQGYAWSAFSV